MVIFNLGGGNWEGTKSDCPVRRGINHFIFMFIKKRHKLLKKKKKQLSSTLVCAVSVNWLDCVFARSSSVEVLT